MRGSNMAQTIEHEANTIRRIGRKLEIARTMLGYSQEEFARLIGKRRSVVSYYESGRTRPPIDVLQKVADVLGVDISWFFSEESPDKPCPVSLRSLYERLDDILSRLQTLSEFARLPVYRSVQAGPWTSVVGDGVVDYVTVPFKWRADFCVVARGESMKPTILDGDVLAVRLYRGEAVRNRLIVVARNQEGEYTVKRYVVSSPGRAELRGESPAYGSLDAAEWQIQGIVVGLLRELG